MRHMKLAGWAGVIGFALAAIGSAVVGLFDGTSIFDFPGSQASGAEITALIAGHRSSVFVAMVLNTFGVELWLVLGVGVWLRLRETGESVLSGSFALGLAGFVTLIFAGFVPFFLLAYRHGDPAHARLLYDLTFGLLAMSGAPTSVALWSYAILVWQRGPLPRWTAVLAAISAGAHDLLLLSFIVSHGFFSLQGQVISAIPATLFIWILGTSIALLREPARQPA
jgi:hypothetical protein